MFHIGPLKMKKKIVLRYGCKGLRHKFSVIMFLKKGPHDIISPINSYLRAP